MRGRLAFCPCCGRRVDHQPVHLLCEPPWFRRLANWVRWFVYDTRTLNREIDARRAERDA